MTARARRRLLVAAGAGVTTGAALAVLFLGGHLAALQDRGVDFLFRSRPPERAAATLVVAIDQRSYRELLPRHGTLVNWPRALYAQAFDRLREGGARVIVLDIFFDAPRPGDDELAAAMRRAGSVIAPVEAQGPRALAPAPGVAQEFDVLVRPTPALRAAAAAEGSVNVSTDADTVVRALPLLLRAGGEEVAAAALVAVARFIRWPTVLDGPPDAAAVHAAGRAIPLDAGGRVRINFLGPPSSPERGGPIPMVPFVDLLEGRVAPDVLRDRIALVGLTIRGIDEHSTPTTAEGRMWGVEILAHAVETVLGGRHLEDVARTTTVALIVVSALLAALATALARPARALGAVLLLLGGYLVAAVVAFDRGLVLSLLFPPAAAVLAFGATLLHRLVFEEAEQRRVRGVIARYLSPAVSQWVLEDPSRLALGGETRDMTVLFCDVRGFTTLSRTLPPPALVALVNEFMTAMSAVVFRHDGVLDKYIGDAVMAFWNAPGAQADHARRACAAALDMIATAERLRLEWARRGLPPLDVGVGVNTGPMVVGNMGSRERLAYTVMGDVVNVASRLEGLSKVYGVRIVIGEATHAVVAPAFACRFLDLVAVKGRAEPLSVYEVLGPPGAADGGRAAALEAYARGVALYRARQWAEAARLFAEVLARAPEDGPAALYLRRATAFAARPPGDDWDGVFVAETK